MSNISEATQHDWEDFWYSPEKFGTWYPEDTLSNPEEKIKLLTNCEMLC